jgi:hypothetical protein
VENKEKEVRKPGKIAGQAWALRVEALFFLDLFCYFFVAMTKK